MSGMIRAGSRSFGGQPRDPGSVRRLAAVPDALLGMADRRALHRPLHRARAAACADRKTPEPELVAHLLGVVVLLARDGVPAPADDQVRAALVFERARVSQDAEDRVGDACRIVEVEARHDLVVRVDDVPQYREQVFLDAPIISRRRRRCRACCISSFIPGSPRSELESFVARRSRARRQRAGVQHRERAASKQRIEAAGRVEQLVESCCDRCEQLSAQPRSAMPRVEARAPLTSISSGSSSREKQNPAFFVRQREQQAPVGLSSARRILNEVGQAVTMIERRRPAGCGERDGWRSDTKLHARKKSVGFREEPKRPSGVRKSPRAALAAGASPVKCRTRDERRRAEQFHLADGL